MFPSKNEVFNKIEILKSNSARVDLEFENVHETRYLIIFCCPAFSVCPDFPFLGTNFVFSHDDRGATSHANF